MARLTREESQGRTRELLIDAARQAFARSGFGGASVGDIAEAAGFSKGAFYSNFESKEAILLELLRRHRQRVVEDLRSMVDGGTPQSILASLGSWLATRNRDPDWALLAVELQLHAARCPSFATEYQAVYREHRTAIGGLIAMLFHKAGKKPPADLEDLAAGCMALAQGLNVLQRADQAGQLVTLFLESLLATATPARRAAKK